MFAPGVAGAPSSSHPRKGAFNSFILGQGDGQQIGVSRAGGASRRRAERAAAQLQNRVVYCLSTLVRSPYLVEDHIFEVYMSIVVVRCEQRDNCSMSIVQGTLREKTEKRGT